MRLLRVLVAFLVSTCTDADAPDDEYQKWAATTFDESDKAAIQRGKALSCVLCNLLTKTVLETHQLNKKKPLHERFDQDQTQEVLLDLCSELAAPISRQMDVIREDVLMVCNRVVKENIGDMMDAVSLGEEVRDFCTEQKLCDLTFAGMEKMQQLMMELGMKKDKEDL
ncbi:hypothetical protein AK812_SmicGene29748 [Symbiodinium microadriaticum]|uniref:Uncharacterized protein n=1 Tax=Symbiodinium microadriaticum TaxID=2951 RepID=A0A1Q9D131_SYMMI|nr:hypothetical protein AK812_SmicGene29748 [Symbiodinium microadriaticum]CAE7776590.1 unnamed protein product [Symbiodinium microadriaticum]